MKMERNKKKDKPDCKVCEKDNGEGSVDEDRAVWSAEVEDEEQGDDAAHAAIPHDDLALERDLLFSAEVEEEREEEGVAGAGHKAHDQGDDNEPQVPVCRREVFGQKEENPKGYKDHELRQKVETAVMRNRHTSS